MTPDPLDSSRESLSRETADLFTRRFGRPPSCLVSAPGRVNLIGEHTDYNDGFVFPGAINRTTVIASAPRPDDQIIVHAQNLNSTMLLSLHDLVPRKNGAWSNYVGGVAQFLRMRGDELHGADLLINSTVPRGSGLSSSAALEVAAAYTFITLNGLHLTEVETILLCQKVENEFVGVKCGIMDQFISALGRKDHALKIDCRSLAYEHVPFPEGIRLVVCDTNVRRALASSEYNRRREECTAGARILARHKPGVRNLRDVNPEEFASLQHHLDDITRRRCRHVVAENARVEESVRALNAGDLARFGLLMYESHTSLRDDYEVSCPELDAVVEICSQSPGVFGARMTGAGFGGCAICIVREESTDAVLERLARLYPEKTGKQPGSIVCTLEQGVSVSRL